MTTETIASTDSELRLRAAEEEAEAFGHMVRVHLVSRVALTEGIRVTTEVWVLPAHEQFPLRYQYVDSWAGSRLINRDTALLFIEAAR